MGERRGGGHIYDAAGLSCELAGPAAPCCPALRPGWFTALPPSPSQGGCVCPRATPLGAPGGGAGRGAGPAAASTGRDRAQGRLWPALGGRAAPQGKAGGRAGCKPRGAEPWGGVGGGPGEGGRTLSQIVSTTSMPSITFFRVLSISICSFLPGAMAAPRPPPAGFVGGPPTEPPPPGVPFCEAVCLTKGRGGSTPSSQGAPSAVPGSPVHGRGRIAGPGRPGRLLRGGRCVRAPPRGPPPRPGGRAPGGALGGHLEMSSSLLSARGSRGSMAPRGAAPGPPGDRLDPPPPSSAPPSGAAHPAPPAGARKRRRRRRRSSTPRWRRGGRVGGGSTARGSARSPAHGLQRPPQRERWSNARCSTSIFSTPARGGRPADPRRPTGALRGPPRQKWRRTDAGCTAPPLPPPPAPTSGTGA